MQSRLSVNKYILISTLILIYESLAQINKTTTVHSWIAIDDWSPCSQTCGNGSQENRMVCLKTLKYSESMVSDEFCKSVKKPDPVIRQCNFGNCQKVYFWRPSSWSACSQTCGNAGRKTREIDCLYNEGEHKMELSSDEYCEPELRPLASSACNLLNCPPVFLTGNWGKCLKSQECRVGKQGRSLDCVVLQKTGQLKKVSKTPCYSKYLPPPSWRICFDHINTKDCLKLSARLPEIETNNNTFIQMRRTKKLKLQIGQVAYILLFSRIVLRCTVNHFVAKDIIWKHKSNTYKYMTHSKNRIRVDQKGRIHIAKFAYEDQGLWTCVAGPVKASSVLKFRNPSIGYHDWVLRSTLWNKNMLNEAPQGITTKNEVIQWIIGAWSPCSITCGGEGIQSRDVHCEEIDTRHYSILDDKICKTQGQKRPADERSCLRTSLCPKWILSDHNNKECSDECLRIGIAKIKGNLLCSFQEKEIDINACSRETMPSIGCSNDKCQVTWKISNWSKCSLSCGGIGIRARYLECIWKNTGHPAGTLCYQQLLSVPRVIQACAVPRCNLKCLDLYTSCQKREQLCKLSIYRYMCCKTCRNVFLKLRIKSMEDKFVIKMNRNDQEIIDSTRKYRDATTTMTKSGIFYTLTSWKKGSKSILETPDNMSTFQNTNSTGYFEMKLKQYYNISRLLHTRIMEQSSVDTRALTNITEFKMPNSNDLSTLKARDLMNLTILKATKSWDRYKNTSIVRDKYINNSVTHLNSQKTTNTTLRNY